MLIDGLGKRASDLFEMLNWPYWSDKQPKGACLGRIVVITGQYDSNHVPAEVSSGTLIIRFSYSVPELEVALRVLGWCRAIFKLVHELEFVGLNTHASCVAVNGTGVLITGDRGAGKTTLALSLAREHATFVSNDQCVVFQRASQLETIAYPALIAVRDLELLSVLSGWEPTRSFSAEDGAADGIRREYSIHDVAQAMRCEVAAGTAVSTLVHYVQRRDIGEVRVTPWTMEEWIAHSRLPLEDAYSTSVMEIVRVFVASVDDRAPEEAWQTASTGKSFRVEVPPGGIQDAIEVIRSLAASNT